MIHLFRKCFEGFFEANARYEQNELQRLTKEQRELDERFFKISINKQLFSDSMIYYTSLAENLESFPITSVHSLLTGVASIFIITLSRGVICRGAIEVGIAWEFYENEIYGPALYHAHRLESEVAQYPRVVVGNELCNYIMAECLRKKVNKIDEIRSGIAEKCKLWICRDLDGVNILDYLGKGAKEQPLPDVGDRIDSALEFADKEWNRFKKEGNSKLAGRYFFLRSYLVNRKQMFWS